MYEISKEIIEKISKANCLSDSELAIIEIALRINDIYDDILDEAIGLSSENKYELKYKCTLKELNNSK